MSEKHNIRHVVSITTGCNSTYLLLRMVEREMPIDAVLYADTGMEFPEAYEHLEHLDKWLYQQRGIHITRLKHPDSFEYLLLESPIHSPYQRTKRKRLGISLLGNGWPRNKKRWCCEQMIHQVIDQEICRMEKETRITHYVPLSEEYSHCIAPRQHHSETLYPLIEWNENSQQTRLYCLVNGFSLYSNPAYNSFCTCWFCPFRMRTEQAFFRESNYALWKRLLELEQCAREHFGDKWIGQFREDYSLPAYDKCLNEIAVREFEEYCAEALKDLNNP